MSITPDSKRPWWREPMVWLIAGLPLAAVVAGITTVVIASRNADSLVKEGYVKEGMTVQGTQEQDRAAVRLHDAPAAVELKGCWGRQDHGPFHAEPPWNRPITQTRPESLLRGCSRIIDFPRNRATRDPNTWRIPWPTSSHERLNHGGGASRC